MSHRLRSFALASLVSGASLLGCAVDSNLGNDESDFTSYVATQLVADFDGELVSDDPWSPQQLIEDQMLYTIGQLNGDHAVGRLDKLELSQVRTDKTSDGKTRIRYHARLPIAWGSKANLPKSYTLRLPRHGDGADYESFTKKYMHDCVDWGAHEVDSGSMWYYYRPNASSCRLDAADVISAKAKVTVSKDNTKGKYPEYHKVWEDKALKVVAIFGKYEDGATSGDAGIEGYNTFLSAVRERLGAEVTSLPAEVPSDPGVSVPDVTFRATRSDGRQVEVVALLVDNVRTAGPAFDARYEELSTDADMIFYNGHAGLGQNVRALAQKGKFKPGQYQIFFMNGCDTFAYVDGYLAQARAALNPDDPTGTRYMDMVTNAMPSFFSSMPHASLALIDGLLGYHKPLSYEQIFRNVDASEIVLVTGEEDNVFKP